MWKSLQNTDKYNVHGCINDEQNVVNTVTALAMFVENRADNWVRGPFNVHVL